MIKKKRVGDIALILVGSAITAFGVGGFITPAKLAGGGVSGLSVILYHTINLEVGTAIFLLSLPLFIAGMKIFGFRYGIISFIGTLLLSVFTFLVGKVFGFGGFLAYNDSMDILLSALFGGFLQGFGIGLVLKGGANTGGTDIGAQILAKYTPLSVGTSLFFVDGLVILAGGFAFGLESALFATITLYVTSLAINFVILKMGTSMAKTAYIITQKHEVLSKHILRELGHGGTLIPGKGLYTKDDRPIIMTVIPNQKISILTSIVKRVDPEAFLIIEEAYEVIGEGFTPISTK
jgi:uncharacterized membrane-anchored protein YitT (DUF2179 family)